MIIRFFIFINITLLIFSASLGAMEQDWKISEQLIKRDVSIKFDIKKTLYAAIDYHKFLLGYLANDSSRKLVRQIFSCETNPQTDSPWTALTGVRVSSNKVLFAVADSLGGIQCIVWSGDEHVMPKVFPLTGEKNSYFDKKYSITKIVINLRNKKIKLYQKISEKKFLISWIDMPDEILTTKL